MYELTIAGHFAAAHYLQGYDGPCKELHGHTWRLQITVQSAELNALGMVVDFKDLKARLEVLLQELDHGLLNDRPAFQEQNPTTENLARYVYQRFAELCAPMRVKEVRVWESDSSSVRYYE